MNTIVNALMTALQHSVQAQLQLGELVGIDDLTGLYNRRGMRAQWPTLAEVTTTVAVCDIDHFKMINDRYGHDAGDVMICRIADLIRAFNLTGVRFGGDEFAVFIPTGVDGLTTLHTLAAACTAPVTVAHNITATMTISVGAVSLQEIPRREHPDPDLHLSRLLRRADNRLYAAKAFGRARIIGPAKNLGPNQ